MSKAFSKRLIVLLMATLLVFCSFAGCKGQTEENVSGGTDGPTNSYMPPVNEDGYIVVTLPIGSSEENSTFFWTSVTANEDGSFKYTFTPEQFQKTKQASYMYGKLIDVTTNTYTANFVKSTEYADIDQDGVPWSLVVFVDRELYASSAPHFTYAATRSMDSFPQWEFRGGTMDNRIGL